jgi:hypothetical protein
VEVLFAEKLTLNFIKNRLLGEESKRKELGRKPKNEIQSLTAFAAPAGHSLTNGNLLKKVTNDASLEICLILVVQQRDHQSLAIGMQKDQEIKEGFTISMGCSQLAKKDGGRGR